MENFDVERSWNKTRGNIDKQVRSGINNAIPIDDAYDLNLKYGAVIDTDTKCIIYSNTLSPKDFKHQVFIRSADKNIHNITHEFAYLSFNATYQMVKRNNHINKGASDENKIINGTNAYLQVEKMIEHEIQHAYVLINAGIDFHLGASFEIDQYGSISLQPFIRPLGEVPFSIYKEYITAPRELSAQDTEVLRYLRTNGFL